jgi:Undecaprenyl-phosphate galactose phosphotransferase WbaP
MAKVKLHAFTEQAAAPVSQGDLPLERRQPARWRQRLITLLLVSSDVFLALLIWYAAFALQGAFGRGELSAFSIAGATANVGVWVGLRALLGLYPGYGLNYVEELRRQTYAVAATLMITSVFALAFQVGDMLSRLLLVFGFLGLLNLAPPLRYLVKRGTLQLGLWGKPVVILGAGETGERLVKTLKREWSLGFRPIAVFDNRLAPAEGAIEGVPYGGTLTDAMDLAWERLADTAIFAMPHARCSRLAKFVELASRSFRNVIVIPNLAGVTTSAVVARDFVGTLGLEMKQNLPNTKIRRIKRAVDLCGTMVGGFLIGPFLLLIIALIKLDSPGPTFYRQLRPGFAGQYFWMWKFRTMHVDGERLLTELLQSDPDLQLEWQENRKLSNDPRITRIGRLLRVTSLDELPQLWNVLRGEMSLVGPRPILVEEIPQYGEVYQLYKHMRPGITGLWQVSGRNDTSYEERLEMVAYYVRSWSIWLDLVILARTAGSLVLRRGAY